MTLQDTLERVLSLSRADACIVVGSASSSVNVRWANNTSTTNGVVEAVELSVVSVIDRRVGAVSVSYFPEDSLERLVRQSEAVCAGKPEAEDYMPLVDGDGFPADWELPAQSTGPEALEGLAPALARVLEQADADGASMFGYAERGTSTTYLATSTGLRRRHTRPSGRVEVNAKSRDFTRSAWAGKATPALGDVDLSLTCSGLRQRLEWSKSVHELPPGHYQVLLEPSAVADMLVYAYWSSAARDADEGRSVFSKPGGGNRVGERLYSPGVTVYSDPCEAGIEVAPFSMAVASSALASVFDSGQDTARTEWVSDGVLRALVTPRYWAARSGAERATPYIDNLVFAATSGPTLEEMIASTERALLVASLWYIRDLDPQSLLLTGLTRDGVFLVEDGEVKAAVNNFRFNVSPVQMLAQVSEIGRAEATLPRELGDYFDSVKMPPLRVEGFNMSSVSEAV